MQRVTFGQFLQRTTIFEHTPVDVDSGLRRGAWISWLMIGAYWIIYRYLPDGSFIEGSLFFQWTRRWLSGMWNFVADYRQILLIACAFMFSMILMLFVLTRGFHLAEIRMQIALFVPIVFTAVNLPFVVILLLPLLVNLFLWLCAGTLILIGGTALLGAFLWMLSH
jgi:hypothetical protein